VLAHAPRQPQARQIYSVRRKEMSRYEKVYTVTDYYDGPRCGIADFCGKPHVYESVFDDLRDGYTDEFLLMPIEEDVLRFALEAWQIWCRWEDAFHERRTPPDTHPALPEDRKRHEELKAVIGDRLSAKTESSLRANAEFRTGLQSPLRRVGIHDLEVHWTLVTE
jgi:hypothetical protein